MTEWENENKATVVIDKNTNRNRVSEQFAWVPDGTEHLYFVSHVVLESNEAELPFREDYYSFLK
jgi:hypothetical protein